MATCAGLRKDGSPCGRKPCRDPDPDGQIRCWEHSTDPDRVAAREAGHQRARAAGAEGEVQHKARRKAVKQARAQGRGPPVEERRGSRGPTPLPKNGQLAAPAPTAQPTTTTGPAEPDPARMIDGKTLAQHMAECSVNTADGRSRLRDVVSKALALGILEARDAEVLLRNAKDAANDKAARGRRVPIRINWRSISSRADAEAFRAEQELRENAS